ncbi:hypothetical protein BGZ65_001744 [Modicella reniformis]|uniref:Uncharacterized protein n=1 Tax=Modicella reniformis TaxID=1440133 RepID=A0A9P6SMU2_9FUNG|nr:hypothetical protein BGZ65_001744 [Modicella reniformis]
MPKTKNPLEIPEILALVGMYIPMWQPVVGGYSFHPQDMLSCTLVSHHFRITLLPILWYTFDEKASSAVPIENIRKYTPYFRHHFNYGYRKDYPTHCREPCTRLTQLTIAVSQKGEHDIEFIKSNPGLKRLECTENYYSDAFTHLSQLEHLRYQNMGNKSHQQSFQLISKNLKSLRLKSSIGKLGLEGLVFPNLKELSTDLCDLQDAMDLLHGCPNLESLESVESFSPRSLLNVTQALKSGACPVLRSMRLRALNGQEEDLAVMLKNRRGLTHLDLNVALVSVNLIEAIGCHASSLTHLAIRGGIWAPSTFSFLLEILSSRGHLKDVRIQGMTNEAIDPLITKMRWKNPDVLESLTLKSDTLILGGEQVKSEVFTMPSDDCLGPWMLPPGKESRTPNLAFLKVLFKMAQGFSGLRTITINDVVYRKFDLQ